MDHPSSYSSKLDVMHQKTIYGLNCIKDDINHVISTKSLYKTNNSKLKNIIHNLNKYFAWIFLGKETSARGILTWPKSPWRNTHNGALGLN